MDDQKREQPARPVSTEVKDAAQELPLGMRIAAAWSWRLIIVGIALAGFIWLIVQVRIIVIPLLVAILLAALLAPVVQWFVEMGLPKWTGVIAALTLFVTAVWILIHLIITQFRSGFDDLTVRSAEVWQEFLRWAESDLDFVDISAYQLDSFVAQIMQTVEEHQSAIWSGALGIATTAGQVAAGTLLTLFSLIFLLIDGKRIWYWVLGFTPAKAHAPLDAAGVAGWVSVGQYVRVQIFVAFVDAVGIGLGAFLLGVPLPIPIAVLVFMGSFIPFLGAISTGALAAFIALAYNGPVNALMMLGVVILVNQIEGHVLQPLVMGNAVRVHPLGVVLVVSAGALLAGIPGALFAVPLAASANAIVNSLMERRWDPGADPVADYLATSKKHQLVRARVRRVARQRRKEGN
ncbi:AI-2E family transporter [Leucobacter sp. GX24907]